MDNYIGFASKLVRESQKITIDELYEEMNTMLTLTIEDIKTFEDKGIYEPKNGLNIADFIAIYFKSLLNMVNAAGVEMYEYAELWRKREEVLRGFIMSENQFKKLKRYVNTVKSAALVDDEQEVYEQMVDFEKHFQDSVKLETGVNGYAWA